MKYCPTCDVEHKVSAGDKFCPTCGSEFTAKPTNFTFCPKCGKELEENSVFCGNCGKNLVAAPSSIDTQKLKDDTQQVVATAKTKLQEVIAFVMQRKTLAIAVAAALVVVIVLAIAIPTAVGGRYGARSPEQLVTRIERSVSRANSQAFFRLTHVSQMSDRALRDQYGLTRAEMLTELGGEFAFIVEEEIDFEFLEFEPLTLEARVFQRERFRNRYGLLATDFRWMHFFGDRLLAAEIDGRWFVYFD